ncbi:MAG: hypothetical protein IJX58_05165 [Clostridia bacterium]|nr:hypothetical protein [Clostridia bacterium]
MLDEREISKEIISSAGEDEFQIRYIRDENVGILTSRSGKSYFILDSKEYWYDLIQGKYPSKQKCSCKNDFFKVRFDYLLRKETDDFSSVELISQCTECGKIKKFSRVDIDYSPSSHLFENAITYCEQPKIKYKTYNIGGFWEKGALFELIEFLAQKQLLIYLWYWNESGKRCFKQVDFVELTKFLSDENSKYLGIYFSFEPLEQISNISYQDEKGIYIDRNLWRKKELIKIDSPIRVMSDNRIKLCYNMEFCSEFLDSNGMVNFKSDDFCKLVKALLKYIKENLK